MGIRHLLVLGGLIMFLVGCGNPTPLDRWGRLKVEKLQLTSEQGQAVQLRGVSSYNIAGFDWIFNDANLKELRDDWKADVVRLAMYTDPIVAGYLSNPRLEETMNKLVASITKAGLYVIIDWHILADGDPSTHTKEAVEFFGRMAARWKDNKGVILEICNEPNGPGVTWNDRIKPYAETVLAAIRAADPTRVILVGTPTWSQDVDEASKNPLADSQVLYVFHWYAGSHGAELRAKVAQAAKTVALFCSEWGATDNTGNGEVYPDKTNQWFQFLDGRRISSCNWSLSNVREGASALKPKYDGGPMGPLLTPSGKIVYDYLRSPRP